MAYIPFIFIDKTWNDHSVSKIGLAQRENFLGRKVWLMHSLQSFHLSLKDKTWTCQKMNGALHLGDQWLIYRVWRYTDRIYWYWALICHLICIVYLVDRTIHPTNKKKYIIKKSLNIIINLNNFYIFNKLIS